MLLQLEQYRKQWITRMKSLILACKYRRLLLLLAAREETTIFTGSFDMFFNNHFFSAFLVDLNKYGSLDYNYGYYLSGSTNNYNNEPINQTN